MVTSDQVSVTNSPTLLAASDRGGVLVHVKNKGTNPVWLGASDVSSTVGFELASGAVSTPLALGQGEELYAIAAGTETVHVLRFGDEADRAASVIINPSGSQNALLFTAVDLGNQGNHIRVRYVVAGNDTPLTVSVSVKDITVNVATDSGGVATSLASEVMDAVNNDVPASALVTVDNSGTDDGTGVVAAVAYTTLAGGA
jgi:hypothetical protein